MPDGVVLFDAPPTIGHNLRRAVDDVAAAEGIGNTVTHLVYSHHHADHAGAANLFGDDIVRIGHAGRPPPRWSSPSTAVSWRRDTPHWAATSPTVRPSAITSRTARYLCSATLNSLMPGSVKNQPK